MVAVASHSPAARATARSSTAAWSLAAAGVLVIGAGVRLAIGGAGVGERSALLMMLLVVGGSWVAARQVWGPRAALMVAVVLTALFDLSALPPRDQPAYDDLEAYYSTDQVLNASVPVSTSGAAAISLLVQPVFSGPRAQFGLAGDVNGTAYEWTCPFARAVQTVALPLPTTASGPQVDLRLHLTGAPRRDGDYLIVYASSRQGGFVVSAGPVDPGVTRCSLT